MSVRHVAGSARQVLLKIFRLIYLSKYHAKGEGSRAKKTNTKISDVSLIDQSDAYKIIDAANSLSILVTWPEKFFGPINRFSNMDGYWAVEARRWRGGANSYLLYWLYPFDHALHVWRLNSSGERVGCYDANGFEKYRFFFDRWRLAPSFLVRFFMLGVAWGDNKTCVMLKADLLAHAKDGFSEAIYCILSCPKIFSKEELRSCVDQAIININFICSNIVPIHERKIQLMNLEKLTQSLSRHKATFDYISIAEIWQKIDNCAAFGDIRYADLRFQIPKKAIHIHDSISATCHMSVNFHNQAITVVGTSEDSTVNFHLLNRDVSTRGRMMTCVGYANYLISICEQEKLSKLINPNFDKNWILDFDAGDLPVRSECISFVRALDAHDIGLIPDPYYFSSWGFRQGWINGAVPPWTSKMTRFTWRGVTTGGHNHTLDTISTLPRFRLCAIGGKLGPLADLGISSIIGAKSEKDARKIRRYLNSSGLWKDYIPPHAMGRSKFLLEIDGNSNSWGFFAKLIMGSCILKVDSPYEQWFYRDLEPWVHYVPIARDLSNLLDTMQWCLLNEPACREIASAGQAFAQERTFEREMKAAAATLASFVRPVD